jgi:hypothetical protein
MFVSALYQSITILNMLQCYYYLRQWKSGGIKWGKAHIFVSVANTSLEVAYTKIDSASNINKNSNYMLFHICDIVRFYI